MIATLGATVVFLVAVFLNHFVGVQGIFGRLVGGLVFGHILLSFTLIVGFFIFLSFGQLDAGFNLKVIAYWLILVVPSLGFILGFILGVIFTGNDGRSMMTISVD